MIVIYGASWCGPCQEARKLLERKSIAHDYRDVDRDHEAQAVVAEARVVGHTTLPVIYDGERLIGGFSELRRELGA